MTFARDIRFGVLYEQLKAKENLKNMINNTFQRMICRPLQNVVSSCKRIQNSKDLKLFEEFRLNKHKYNLREQLGRMMMQSEFIILKSNDMQDW